MNRILVVDDDVNTCKLLSRLLSKEGMEIRTATDPCSVSGSFSKDYFDLVITDLNMPGMTGIELLNEIKKASPDTDVIVMTAFASIDSAVEAMKKGAYDYIVKPFQADDLALSVQRVCEKRRLARENKYLRSELNEKYGIGNIIGRAPAMQKLYALINRAAESDASVLLLGESGTGKELVARAIHSSGNRRDKGFVAVNCSSLPDNLLESELFGHVKGAFTGATSHKQGLFEFAEGGTLFLDEIAETSRAVQAKLLRAIEDKRIRRLGENREIEVDVRIITATSRNLKSMVMDNSFREDLFYRINVLLVDIPPLRERRDDIPLLAGHFLRGRKMLHPAALDVLNNYSWPGNVRELENMLERLVVFTRADQIGIEDLPKELGDLVSDSVPPGMPYLEAKKKVLEDFNRSIIRRTLAQAEGNVTRTAEKLRIDRANLQRLMRKFGISSSEYKAD